MVIIGGGAPGGGGGTGTAGGGKGCVPVPHDPILSLGGEPGLHSSFLTSANPLIFNVSANFKRLGI